MIIRHSLTSRLDLIHIPITTTIDALPTTTVAKFLLQGGINGTKGANNQLGLEAR